MGSLPSPPKNWQAGWQPAPALLNPRPSGPSTPASASLVANTRRDATWGSHFLPLAFLTMQNGATSYKTVCLHRQTQLGEDPLQFAAPRCSDFLRANRRVRSALPAGRAYRVLP